MKIKLWVLILILLLAGYSPGFTSNNAPDGEIALLTAISLLSKKYDVYFTYDRTLVDDINVEYDEDSKTSIDDELEVLLSKTDLKFKVFKSEFVLRERAGVNALDYDWANANPDPFLKERYPNLTGENARVLLEIRRERRVELAFEDFRIGDLMRWAAGDLLTEAPSGMYFPGLGQYDMTGDGVVDIALISADQDIPFEDEKETNSLGEKLIYYRVSTIADGSGTVYLENGEEGGKIITENATRTFVTPQYYYRPIPATQMVLNPNLEQIFGW